MKSTDIKAARWNNNEVSALYKGSTLIFRKKMKSVIAGKVNAAGNYSIFVNEELIPVQLNDDLSFELEVPELTSCNSMFIFMTQLTDIYSFPDTSNVTNMTAMFINCSQLTKSEFDFDTSNVSAMGSMFFGCSKITNMTLNFDTSNVTNMTAMFKNCRSLRVLNLSNFDMSKVTNMMDMFVGCEGLMTVAGHITGISCDLNLGYSSYLTNESVMVFVNGLAEVSSTKTLSLEYDAYDTLTEEQIALATSKGWSVVSC